MGGIGEIGGSGGIGESGVICITEVSEGKKEKNELLEPLILTSLKEKRGLILKSC